MAIIEEAQIIKVLRQYNPWWSISSAVSEESKPYKRTAYYETLKVIEHKSIRRFAVLSGLRRVGKTTIMYQIMEKLINDGVNPKNIFYATFDNPILKLAGIESVLSVYESLYPLESTKYIFFDEIQYTDNWELWMKVLYDSRKDISLTATGSASPLLEKGVSDSGTGRWTVIKIPTMSFYEYCKLVRIPEPEIPEGLRISELKDFEPNRLGSLLSGFSHLQSHFNRYLTIGGFPELVLSDDDSYAQKMLREDVVDKVLKRDVMSLFNIRNPLLMEKLFLYLCINSTELFNSSTVAKELDNVSVSTLDTYLKALEMSNLIYISKPVNVGSKAALKGRPKIIISDAAIRNAVLMTDDILSDEKDLGITVETAVFKHMFSFFRDVSAQTGYYRKQGDNQKEIDIVTELPREKILCEVKYRNNSHIPETDAVIEICRKDTGDIRTALIITKKSDDYGKTSHDTEVPVIKIPAPAFLYLLGYSEANRIKF